LFRELRRKTMGFDDDEDFEDEVFEDEDEDEDDVICECNYCHRLFSGEPVLIRYEGAVGVFCSDTCADTALREMQELKERNTQALMDLGLDLFKYLFK
jgi:hypothetical protein